MPDAGATAYPAGGRQQAVMEGVDGLGGSVGGKRQAKKPATFIEKILSELLGNGCLEPPDLSGGLASYFASQN